MLKKTADSKDLETKIKETEANAHQRISEIEKLDDAAERQKQYRALGETLHGVYNDGKPKRVRGRKQTRAEYGSMGNARALYELEQSVKEKAEKEAQAIQAAKRNAQIQQQAFREFSDLRGGGVLFPQVEANLFEYIEAETNKEIREIEELATPAERLARYESLNRALCMFYNDGRPQLRERKTFRPVYGSIGNARTVYKLSNAVYKKIKKEQEIISSLERTAQLQQQFKASFEKEAPADKKGILKEVKAEISEDIKEIKQIDDQAERLKRYKALDKTIDGFYDGIKPEVAGGSDAAFMAIPGGFLGAYSAVFAPLIVAPHIAGPVYLAVIGGGLVSGATGGAGLTGLLGGRGERKQLRAKYGSIRNARAMYRLDKTVEKKAEKEAAPIRSRDRAAKLREQLDEAFKKKEQAAPAETAPAPVVEAAPTPLRLRLRTEGSLKQ